MEKDFISTFVAIVRETANGSLDGVSEGIILAMGVVMCLIIIMSIVSLCVSIYLAISYVKYNKKPNSCGKTGERIARIMLDKHGLQGIQVTKTGSILFGNSYSHDFKKVRLRSLTWQKASVTSLAMAAQKSSLAILDKENDSDMKTRVRLTPLIYLGPVAFIPLIIIGALLDILVLKSSNGSCIIALTIVGLVFYLLSFVMSLMVLKTEKKAQARALRAMKEDGLANDDEIIMSQKLFKLYNIEYVNDMIVALLELIYRALQLVAYVQNSSSSTQD